MVFGGSPSDYFATSCSTLTKTQKAQVAVNFFNLLQATGRQISLILLSLLFYKWGAGRRCQVF